MKIYYHKNLNNINLSNLINLNKYIVKTVIVKDIYANSGLYKIENNKNLSQIIIQDGDIYQYDNYIDNHPIWLDRSIIKKIDRNPTHISNDHDSIDYTQYYYNFQKKSPLYLVIEYYQNKNLKDLYFRFEDTYAAYSDADMNSPFIKEDMIKFLEYL